jgi:hypothetical protein
MDESPRSVRLRTLFSDYFVLVVLVALVVAALGGYLTVTAYAEETTQTRTSQTTAWTERGSFTHSATVVNGTAVYDVGDRLRNRNVYFQQITPRLNGSFLYRHTARESANLTADVDLSLVLRSAQERDNGNVTEYWRLASDLGEREVTLSPGDRLRVPFSVNVTNVSQRLATVDSQFGGTPGSKELFILADVSLAGTRNGSPVETTRTYRLPIALDGSVYEVGAAGPFVDSGSRTVTTTQTVEPGPLPAYGGPLLALVGFLAAICCVGARYTGRVDVSETEREWLAYRDAREEFDDWITRADISATDMPPSTVTVETLEGLVDIAIDVDSRVLRDTDRDGFFVFDENRVYRYDPPELPAQSTTEDALAEPEPSEDGLSAPGDDGDQSTDGTSPKDTAEEAEG